MINKLMVVGILFLLNTAISNAQANRSIAEYNGRQLAQSMAKKAADSLNLTGNQKQQIVQVNMQLHSEKMDIREQYTGQESIMILKIQAVENTRDSLYKPILGDEKYLLYKQKKINLLNNN